MFRFAIACLIGWASDVNALIDVYWVSRLVGQPEFGRTKGWLRSKGSRKWYCFRCVGEAKEDSL